MPNHMPHLLRSRLCVSLLSLLIAILGCGKGEYDVKLQQSVQRLKAEAAAKPAEEDPNNANAPVNAPAEDESDEDPPAEDSSGTDSSANGDTTEDNAEPAAEENSETPADGEQAPENAEAAPVDNNETPDPFADQPAE